MAGLPPSPSRSWARASDLFTRRQPLRDEPRGRRVAGRRPRPGLAVGRSSRGRRSRRSADPVPQGLEADLESRWRRERPGVSTWTRRRVWAMPSGRGVCERWPVVSAKSVARRYRHGSVHMNQSGCLDRWAYGDRLSEATTTDGTPTRERLSKRGSRARRGRASQVLVPCRLGDDQSWPIAYSWRV